MKTPLKGRDRGGGVSYDKSRGKWQAYSDFNFKRTYLGRHTTEIEARAAVDSHNSKVGKI